MSAFTSHITSALGPLFDTFADDIEYRPKVGLSQTIKAVWRDPEPGEELFNRPAHQHSRTFEIKKADFTGPPAVGDEIRQGGRSYAVQTVSDDLERLLWIVDCPEQDVHC